MSAQTGRPTLAPAPPSSRRVERARIQVARMREDPNPVWMRELRQAARLGRTPIILAVVTGMMTLLIAAIGGAVSVTAEPAKVGVALFHVFFSLAFAVVAWVAPAVAASTIAAERSGSTWEALLLTGLGAPTIARGKFLASLTYIGLYIVMLAPVGALPFLFGGVTATEVMAAFVLLMLFAVLAVAFGLSVSSKFSSSAVAIVVSLLVAVPLSIVVYVGGGVGLSYLAHSVWPGVPEALPVWLPTAYARADFGVEYLVFLVLTPVTIVALPAWFLYEVTVSNMAGPSDDRSSGLRRWFLVSTLALTAVAAVPAFIVPDDRWAAAVIGMIATNVFLAFCAFVFAGEPLGPSRRVRVHWDRQEVGRLKRYLGPGLMPAASLLLILGVGGLVLDGAAGVVAELLGSAPDPMQNAYRVMAFAGYSVGFLVFVVGFMAWVRARSSASTAPRLLLLAMLFLAMVGPWIIMAIAGVLTKREDSAMVLAAPSPVYAIQMMKELGRTKPDQLVIGAGAVCAAAWGLLGLGLLGAGGARSRRVVREHDAALAKVDAMLRAEDEGGDEPDEGDAPAAHDTGNHGEPPAGGSEPPQGGGEPPAPEPT